MPWSVGSAGCLTSGRPRAPSGGGCAKLYFPPGRHVRTVRCAAGTGRRPTASWVEPTAHALLFLRSLPAKMYSSQGAKRRQLAERMLYDRICPGGGWNSGNPLVYGVAGVPRVGPTVWALLALRDDAERAEIQMSLDWLQGAYGTIHGPRVPGLGAPLPRGVWAACSPPRPRLGRALPAEPFL